MFKSILETDKLLFVMAIIASLLLSIWAGIVSDVINNDGIEYVKSARAIQAGEWREALEIYKWPFYPALLAAISAITPLGLDAAAGLVSGVAFVGITLAFLALVRILGGDRQTLWFALFAIIMLPPLTKIRSFVIRDPVFLALFLSATYYFFRYYLHRRTGDNLVAMGLYALSALFRIEGLIFLFASQVYLLHRRLVGRSGKGAAFMFLALFFLFTLVVVSWWQFQPNGELTYLSIFTQPVRFLEAAWGQALDDMGQRLHAIRKYILVGYSRSYTFTLFLLSAATIVGIELIDSLYVIYFFCFVAAWRMKLLFPEGELRRPWRFLIWVGLAILFGFVLEQWFLTDRYPLTVALLVLLATPFLLARLYDSLTTGLPASYRRAFVLMLPLWMIVVYQSVNLRSDNLYLKEAGLWLKQTAPAGAKVYVNNRRMAYYFGSSVHTDPYWPGWPTFAQGALAAKPHFEYLAFEVLGDHPQYAKDLPNALRAHPVAKFANERGAQVLIFHFPEQ